MCVIAVYNKGLNLNKTELENCFTVNPDGAGLMYQEKGRVHIIKGFMDFTSFWAVASALPIEVDRVFHFRIATSGKISEGICHPFPICNDYKRMKLVDTTIPYAVAHNGVLANYAPKNGLNADRSDTMVFIKEVLDGLGHGGLIENEVVRDLLEEFTTSRFAIMSARNVYLIGSFEQSRDSKAIYSNSSYKHSYSYGCGYGFSSYWSDYVDDDYQEDYGYLRFPIKYLSNDMDIVDVVDALEMQFNTKIFVDDYEFKNNEVLIYFFGRLPVNGMIDEYKIPFKAINFNDEVGKHYAQTKFYPALKGVK